MIARVISTKMKNTATVLAERTAAHPLYKKTFIRSKKYLVDDQIGVKDGDIVEIIKIRPISKSKHWKIVKVVGQNLAEIVEAKQKEAAEEILAEVMPEEEKGEGESGKGKEEKTSEVKTAKRSRKESKREEKE